jgi:fluoroquinolone transport system ATP-binding protein
VVQAKSTTQKILFGLLKDYEDQVSVMGKEIREWEHDIYEKIGVSFELLNHYPNLTAGENLDYFRTLYERECYTSKEVFEMVGLEDDIDKKVKNFSKGMKIRCMPQVCFY